MADASGYMDTATALLTTPTKETTHLSMACHDLTKEIFDSCHVSVSSSTVLGDSVLTGGSHAQRGLVSVKVLQRHSAQFFDGRAF